MVKKKRVEPVGTSKRAKLLADQAVALADYVAKVHIAADERGIKKKTIKQFPLNEQERATVAALPVLPASLKKKLEKKAVITVIDVCGMLMAISESVVDGDWRALLLVAMKLRNCLQENIFTPIQRRQIKKPKATGTVFQFKITLLGVKPAIWRRIQVKDCSLDKLHEYIQTSMGWSNSHLHRFEIGKKQYADPMLMEEDMKEFGYKDSTTTMLSNIVPKNRMRMQFLYEYDFGDCWGHEVVFEGCPKAEVGGKFPVCLEGERACPPEDCGGWPGYASLLEALGNKKHEEHESMMEWLGGWFDPEDFDPSLATKAMKKGLPDWRSMR